MNISVEDASPEMLDTLYTIEKQSFREDAFSRHQIALLLSDYNSISLAAKVEGKICGFVIGRLEYAQKQLVGHVMTLDVTPACRRKGIATRLMLGFETILRQRNVSESVLEVREDNIAALNLYEKLGYTRSTRLDNYYGRAHGLYLKKSLLTSL